MIGDDTSYTSQPLLLMSVSTPQGEEEYITDWVILTTNNNNQLVVHATSSFGQPIGPYDYAAFFSVISVDSEGRVIVHHPPPFNPNILQQIYQENILLRRNKLPPYVLSPVLSRIDIMSNAWRKSTYL